MLAAAAGGLAAVAAPGAARAAQAPAPGPVGHLGWWPWWLGDAWHALDARALSRVVWFDAPVDADGRVAARDPHAQRHALRAALPPQCRLEVAVTVLGAGAFEAVFAHAGRTARLHDDAVAMVRGAGRSSAAFDGLQLDVEVFDAASPGALARFGAFVDRLRATLDAHAPGATLSAFVNAGPHAPWTRASSARLDHVAAQLYDAHWAGSDRAGPIVERAPGHPYAVGTTLARLDALGVPRARVALGAPLFGYEWPVESDRWGARTRGEGSVTPWADTSATWLPTLRRSATGGARRHGLDRDAGRTPRYRWRDADGWHQGWFEDADSLDAKLVGLRASGYGGLAFFPLGYDGGRLQAAMTRRWRAARLAPAPAPSAARHADASRS